MPTPTPIAISRLPDFDAYLRRLGVPIDGVSNADGTVEGLTVQYQPSVTSAQVALAEQAKATFDWRAMSTLPASSIAASLDVLTASQRDGLLNYLVGVVAQANRVALEDGIAALNLPIPVQRVDPT